MLGDALEQSAACANGDWQPALEADLLFDRADGERERLLCG